MKWRSAEIGVVISWFGGVAMVALALMATFLGDLLDEHRWLHEAPLAVSLGCFAASFGFLGRLWWISFSGKRP